MNHFRSFKSLLFRGWLYFSYYSVLASLKIGNTMKRCIVRRCRLQFKHQKNIINFYTEWRE